MHSNKCSIETLAKENFCHVVGNDVILSIGVIADETFCNVIHTKDSLCSKHMKSEISLESSNTNQILVGGIPSNSCDDTSSVNARVRATQNRNCSWNIEEVFGAERCERT